MHPRTCALTLALLAALTSQSWGLQFAEQDNYRLGREQSVTSCLVVVAGQATVDGTVKDDLFVSAVDRSTLFGSSKGSSGAITLDGVFDNDLWAIGTTVALTGTVRDHARLIALDTLVVDGTLHNDLVAVASVVQFGDHAVAEKDVYLMGKDLTVKGRILGNLWVRSRKVTLAGNVAGNVKIEADDIVVTPETVIGGQLRYASKTELILDKGVKIGAPPAQLAPSKLKESQPFSPGSLAIQVWLYVGALFVGSVFLALFPRLADHSVALAKTTHWRCLLFGYIALCGIPLVALLAFFTVVGIPLSLLLALTFFLLLYFGKFIVAMVVGRMLLRRETDVTFSQLLSTLFVGLMVLYILSNLPFMVGFAFQCWVTLVGLGALVLSLLSQRRTLAPQTGAPGGNSPPAL